MRKTDLVAGLVRIPQAQQFGGTALSVAFEATGMEIVIDLPCCRIRENDQGPSHTQGRVGHCFQYTSTNAGS